MQPEVAESVRQMRCQDQAAGGGVTEYGSNSTNNSNFARNNGLYQCNSQIIFMNYYAQEWNSLKKLINWF